MPMTFFGTDADIAQVWKWLFDYPGMRVFEDSSRPDQPNRWFSTWTEVADALEAKPASLAAWPEPVGGQPRSEQIIFKPAVQRKLGAKGQTVFRSPATIKVGRNNDQNGCLASASISCWSERGARQRSIFDENFLNEVDWSKLRSIERRMERLVSKFSPAKMRSYPVMANAFERYRNGEIKLWNWGEACAYPSPLVKECRPTLPPAYISQ